MSRTLFIVELMILTILEDRLRRNRETLADRRGRIHDTARDVGDDVGFAVL